MNDTQRLDEDDIADYFPDGVIIVRREIEYDAQDAIRIAREKNDGLEPTMDDIMDVIKKWSERDFHTAVDKHEMKYLNIEEVELF